MVRLCDLVDSIILSLHTSMRIANTSGYILEIQNMLVAFNSSSMREDMIEYIIDFNITCNSL